MEMTILDNNFEVVYFLDQFESFIWVDKMFEPGTFELYTLVTDDILKFIKPGYYIRNKDSEHMMIIEDISIESNIETGSKFKAVGRSLESILDRRIIWGNVVFPDVSLQNSIKRLLNISIINPDINNRKISNFIFQPSTDTRITSLRISKEYTGDNLLNAIQNICSENSIGFKIILDDSNNFVFSLYLGTNRSYSQRMEPYVVFSPSFDNLISSNYSDKNSQMKNIVLVVGEAPEPEEGEERQTEVDWSERRKKAVGSKSGLERREMYVDANDIHQKTDDEEAGTITDAEYMALLEKRGFEKLNESSRVIEFDGKCETKQTYIYGEDFVMGDVVQIANEYNIQASSMITEFTWSYSSSGIDTYPTFTSMQDTIITGKNKVTTTLENLKALNTTGTWAANVWTSGKLMITANLDAYDRVIGITVSGKNNLGSDFSFNCGKIEVNNKDLFLSGCDDYGSPSTYYVYQYDADTSTEKTINYNLSTKINSIVLTNTNYVMIKLKAGKVFNNVTFYPMVRYTSENDTFEPYDATLQEDT